MKSKIINKVQFDFQEIQVRFMLPIISKLGRILEPALNKVSTVDFKKFTNLDAEVDLSEIIKFISAVVSSIDESDMEYIRTTFCEYSKAHMTDDKGKENIVSLSNIVIFDKVFGSNFVMYYQFIYEFFRANFLDSLTGKLNETKKLV